MYGYDLYLGFRSGREDYERAGTNALWPKITEVYTMITQQYCKVEYRQEQPI